MYLKCEIVFSTHLCMLFHLIYVYIYITYSISASNVMASFPLGFGAFSTSICWVFLACSSFLFSCLLAFASFLRFFLRRFLFALPAPYNVYCDKLKCANFGFLKLDIQLFITSFWIRILVKF